VKLGNMAKGFAVRMVGETVAAQHSKEGTGKVVRECTVEAETVVVDCFADSKGIDSKDTVVGFVVAGLAVIVLPAQDWQKLAIVAPALSG
jgi:hypothetical protein